jgi:hypothetical protein
MKKLAFIFIFLVLLSGIYFYSIMQNNYNFIAPDETINKNFAEIYSKTGELSYPLDTQSFNDLTRLRGTYILNNKIVPLKFLGFPFILGSIQLFVPEILFLITPLFAVLTMLVLFKIANLVT